MSQKQSNSGNARSNQSPKTTSALIKVTGKNGGNTRTLEPVVLPTTEERKYTKSYRCANCLDLLPWSYSMGVDSLDDYVCRCSPNLPKIDFVETSDEEEVTTDMLQRAQKKTKYTKKIFDITASRTRKLEESEQKISSSSMNRTLVWKNISGDSLNEAWVLARKRGVVSDDFPAFHKHYHKDFQSRNYDTDFKSALLRLTESIQQNHRVGAGFGVGLLNAKPLLIENKYAQINFTTLSDVINYSIQIDRKENPELDPNQQLTYKQTLRFFCIQFSAALKFMKSPYQAAQFAALQISQRGKVEPVAMTELALLIDACLGVDSTSDFSSQPPQKCANSLQHQWNTDYLIKLYRKDKDPAVLKELNYRASGQFELDILKIICTKIEDQENAFQVFATNPWVQEFEKEVRQQQANVAMMQRLTHCFTQYRPSIGFIPYRLGIYARFASPTKEQQLAIDSFAFDKDIQCDKPEKLVSSDTDTDVEEQDFQHSNEVKGIWNGGSIKPSADDNEPVTPPTTTNKSMFSKFMEGFSGAYTTITGLSEKKESGKTVLQTAIDNLNDVKDKLQGADLDKLNETIELFGSQDFKDTMEGLKQTLPKARDCVSVFEQISESVSAMLLKQAEQQFGQSDMIMTSLKNIPWGGIVMAYVMWTRLKPDDKAGKAACVLWVIELVGGTVLAEILFRTVSKYIAEKLQAKPSSYVGDLMDWFKSHIKDIGFVAVVITAIALFFKLNPGKNPDGAYRVAENIHNEFSLKQVGMAAASGNAIFNFGPKLKKAFDWIYGYLYELYNGKPYVRPDPDWMQDACAYDSALSYYNSDEAFAQMSKHKIVADSCQKCIKGAEECLKKIASRDKEDWTHIIYGNLYKKKEEVLKKLHSANRMRDGLIIRRITPFCMMIYGGSGVSKSADTAMLSEKFNDILYAPSETRLAPYALDPNKDHFDGYTENRVAIGDDWNCTRTTDVARLLTLVSPVVEILPVAHIEGKGTTSKIQVIMLTSNMPVTEAKDINFPQAIDRRMHIKLKKTAAEWFMKGKVLDPAKVTAYIDKKISQMKNENPNMDSTAENIERKKLEDAQPWARYQLVDPVDPSKTIDPNHHIAKLLEERNIEFTQPFKREKLWDVVKAAYDAHIAFETAVNNPAQETTVCPVTDQIRSLERMINDYTTYLSSCMRPDSVLYSVKSDILKLCDEQITSIKQRITHIQNYQKIIGVSVSAQPFIPNIEELKKSHSLIGTPTAQEKMDYHGSPITIYTDRTVKEGEGKFVPFSDEELTPRAAVTVDQTYQVKVDLRKYSEKAKLPESINGIVPFPVHIWFVQHSVPVGRNGYIWLGKDELAYDRVKDEPWFKVSEAFMCRQSVCDAEDDTDIVNAIYQSVNQEIQDACLTRSRLSSFLYKTRRYFKNYLQKFGSPLMQLLGVSDAFRIATRVLLSVIFAGLFWMLLKFLGSLLNPTHTVPTMGPYYDPSGKKPAMPTPIIPPQPKATKNEDPRLLAEFNQIEQDRTVTAFQRINVMKAIAEDMEITKPLPPEIGNVRAMVYKQDEPMITENAMAIRYKIQRNQRLCLAGAKFTGLFLRGNLLAVPFHAVHYIQKYNCIYITYPNANAIRHEIGKVVRVKDTDLAVVEVIDHPPQRDIIRYIAREFNENAIGSCGVTWLRVLGDFRREGDAMVVKHYRYQDSPFFPSIKRRVFFTKDPAYLVDVDVGDAFFHSGVGVEGQSGSACVCNSQTMQDTPIVGIQNFLMDGYVGATVIRQAEVLEAVQKFQIIQWEDDVLLPDAENIEILPPQTIMPTFSVNGISADVCAIVHDDDKRAGLLVKNIIQPSPIYNEIKQLKVLKRYPAITSTVDPRWKRVSKIHGVKSYLSNSFIKQEKDYTRIWPTELVKASVTAWAQYFREHMELQQRPVNIWDIPTAIIGGGGNRMDPHTSPGVPYLYRYPGSKGKSALYQIDEYGGLSYLNPDFVNDCEVLLSKLQRGIIPAAATREFPKMELRDEAKLHKTRSISGVPADWVVVCRQLMGDFLNRFLELGNGLHPSIVGINPTSMDWRRLYDRLCSKSEGRFCVAIDISGWDGKFSVQLAIADARARLMALGHTYKCKCNFCKAVLTLSVGIVAMPSFADKVLINNTRGQKSGSPTTAPTNTIGHLIEFYMMYIEILTLWLEGEIPSHPEIPVEGDLDIKICLTFPMFMFLVAPAFYGDDMVVSIDRRILHIFNGQTINDAYLRRGKVATSAADKSQGVKLYQDISEITILKRSFRPCDGIVYAPIERNVLFEIVSFIRAKNNTTLAEQFVINFNVAATEAVQHGEEFYEHFMDIVHSAAVAKSLRVYRTPFREALHIVKANYYLSQYYQVRSEFNELMLEDEALEITEEMA